MVPILLAVPGAPCRPAFQEGQVAEGRARWRGGGSVRVRGRCRECGRAIELPAHGVVSDLRAAPPAGDMGLAVPGRPRAPHVDDAAMSTSAAEDWNALVAALATMPDLVERLLAAHTPTPDGRWCTTCTTPGRGTPSVPWPCVIAALADEAAV